MMPAPPWWYPQTVKDNWQATPRGATGVHL